MRCPNPLHLRGVKGKPSRLAGERECLASESGIHFHHFPGTREMPRGFVLLPPGLPLSRYGMRPVMFRDRAREPRTTPPRRPLDELGLRRRRVAPRRHYCSAPSGGSQRDRGRVQRGTMGRPKPLRRPDDLVSCTDPHRTPPYGLDLFEGRRELAVLGHERGASPSVSLEPRPPTLLMRSCRPSAEVLSLDAIPRAR